MKRKKQICVVIPIYKIVPTDDELFSIRNTIRRLPSYDIFLIAPKGLDLKMYDNLGDVRAKFFHPRFFKSLFGYNKLMLKITFYSKFNDYEYMLIVQPDALIIRDDVYLNELISKTKYDYWGAPWKYKVERRCFDWTFYNKWLAFFDDIINFISPKFRDEVGNGGLSLRNIHSVVALLKRNFIYKTLWGGPEDTFFCFFGQKQADCFLLADRKSASDFAWEETIHENLLLYEVPFGVHDWQRYFPDIFHYLYDMQESPCFFNKIFSLKNGYEIFLTQIVLMLLRS